MNVFILGAGFGTRLRPITEQTPKPLVKLLNKEMIQYNLFLFYKHGYKKFVINTSYLKEVFESFEPDFPVDIQYSIEERPLGTGGGIRHAMPLLNAEEDTIIMNGDIFYDFDMEKLTSYHQSQNSPLATLVLKPNPKGNVTAHKGKITSLRGIKSASYKETDSHYQFTGLHVLSSELMQKVDDFCIIDTYIKHLDTNRISAFIDDQAYWADIGTLDAYFKTSIYLAEHYQNLDVFNEYIDPKTFLLTDAKASCSILGEGLSIEDGVSIKKSLVLSSYKKKITKDLYEKFLY